MKRADFGKLTPHDVDEFRRYGLTRYTYDQVKPEYDKCRTVEIEVETVLSRIDQARNHYDTDTFAFINFPDALRKLNDIACFELFGMFSQTDRIEKFPLTVWKKTRSQIKKALKKAYPLLVEVEWLIFMECN